MSQRGVMGHQRRNRERLLSGGQYRGVLRHCGRRRDHAPHLNGQVDVGVFWWHIATQGTQRREDGTEREVHLMDCICLGVEDELGALLQPHPAEGLFAVEPIPGQPIAFTYIGPDDEQDFLGMVEERRLAAEERRRRPRPEVLGGPEAPDAI